jgi:hypothetical protein
MSRCLTAGGQQCGWFERASKQRVSPQSLGQASSPPSELLRKMVNVPLVDPSLTSILLPALYLHFTGPDLMKLFRARFSQREGTPDSALLPNLVRQYGSCDCLNQNYERGSERELKFHCEVQDTTSDAWIGLEQHIAETAASGGDELNPIAAIGPERWGRIVTLPRSIKNLKSVKFLSLYGSHLVRIPPEIGGMTSLEEFDPYTSYCLHWFPYEITHCRQIEAKSCFNTCSLWKLQILASFSPIAEGDGRRHSGGLQCLWWPIHRSWTGAGMDLAVGCD